MYLRTSRRCEASSRHRPRGGGPRHAARRHGVDAVLISSAFAAAGSSAAAIRAVRAPLRGRIVARIHAAGVPAIRTPAVRSATGERIADTGPTHRHLIRRRWAASTADAKRASAAVFFKGNIDPVIVLASRARGGAMPCGGGVGSRRRYISARLSVAPASADNLTVQSRRARVRQARASNVVARLRNEGAVAAHVTPFATLRMHPRRWQRGQGRDVEWSNCS